MDLIHNLHYCQLLEEKHRNKVTSCSHDNRLIRQQACQVKASDNTQFLACALALNKETHPDLVFGVSSESTEFSELQLNAGDLSHGAV